MKINESTLVSYATSSDTPPDKEGWLWKRGEVNRAFQKRYFVLKGNVLFYFEKQSDKEPVGFIILEGCTVELDELETDKFAFKLSFHGDGNRVYVLGTDDQESQEVWMKLLACASYDYMKLMVLELEQKLRELDDMDHSHVQLVLPHHALAFPDSSCDSMKPHSPLPAALVGQSRCNPFNKEDTLMRTAVHAGLAASSRGSQTTWAQMHSVLGQKILVDRMDWCSRQRAAGADSQPTIN